MTCHLWHNTYIKFEELLIAISNEPVFETGLLLAENVDPEDVRRQLSRWVNSAADYTRCLCHTERQRPILF